LAAGNTKKTMDVLLFWKKMNLAVPGIFEKLDGWASHSYPNHGFVGTPYQNGRTSVRGYQWELSILKKSFNLKKDLPVFITETGWPYQINKVGSFYSPEKAAQFIQYSFEHIWLKDNRVKAVTPFVLFYPQSPFKSFSWLDLQQKATPQYERVKGVHKTAWWPEQENRFEIVKTRLPAFMPTHSQFQGSVFIRNTGQSIWGERGKFEFPRGPIINHLQFRIWFGVVAMFSPETQSVFPLP